MVGEAPRTHCIFIQFITGEPVDEPYFNIDIDISLLIGDRTTVFIEAIPSL